MKKSIISILVIFMVCISFTAMAEDIDISNGYAGPFDDIKWDATYADLKEMGMEASQGSNSNEIRFSKPGISYSSYEGMNYMPEYIFTDGELTEIQALCLVGDNNNYDYFVKTMNALTETYGGEFEISYIWADEASKVNYLGASDAEMNKAVAKEAVTCIATMNTQVSTISVKVEGVHNKVFNCVVFMSITRNNPMIQDSTLPLGLITE